MSAKLTSRFPRIIAGSVARVRAANLATAERIADGARDLVEIESGDLYGAIHTEVDGDDVYVVAGDEEVFYGHIVEHGSVHSAAKPFLTPAAEAQRLPHRVAIAKAYVGL